VKWDWSTADLVDLIFERARLLVKNLPYLATEIGVIEHPKPASHRMILIESLPHISRPTLACHDIKYGRLLPAVMQPGLADRNLYIRSRERRNKVLPL
jgi:hypothetical protein